MVIIILVVILVIKLVVILIIIYAAICTIAFGITGQPLFKCNNMLPFIL